MEQYKEKIHRSKTNRKKLRPRGRLKDRLTYNKM